MDELDLLIEKHHKKDDSMESKDFIKFVEETLDKFYDNLPRHNPLTEGILNEEFEKGKEFVLSLPKFAPNENWGKPGSDDREAVDKIFNAIGGSATLKAKLEFLIAIENPDSGITSPRRIISSLIILESLSSILLSFQASPAGYVFEAFLAALLRGHQIPAAGAGTIADLEAFSELPPRSGSKSKKRPGSSISLKLLAPGTEIEGSYTDLIDSLNKTGTMTYVVARKVEGILRIESFVFTRDNFLRAISTMAKGNKLKSTAGLFTLPGKSGEESLEHLNSLYDWGEKYAELQLTPGYRGKSSPAKVVPEEEIGMLPESTQLLAESRTQWSVNQSQLNALGEEVEHSILGELPYAPEKIYKIAEMRMQALDQTLLDLFSATKSLSDNINLYFSEEERRSAINAGQSAIVDTTKVADNLKYGIQKDEKE